MLARGHGRTHKAEDAVAALRTVPERGKKRAANAGVAVPVSVRIKADRTEPILG
ncbi:hypothetical protein PAT3040_05747 [Paenibacillus agaridevorans]|uniref:Uncharacterized protein n=1 Tax=Paenibacillus agaridevorans TaxID=171404 RepID=A0A2R5F3G3_9BACL|nr:hypothetical protein PAT3040_05747 [Paenibacillus agaridevorans]